MQDTRLDRVWDKLDANYDRYEKRTQTVRRLAPVAAGAALLALAVVGWRFGFTETSPLASPLSQEGGALIATENVFQAGPAIVLSDGSRLEGSAAAKLSVVENEPTKFETRLELGRVLFEVRPTDQARKRTWSIHAGPVSVEVVGTRFAVTHRVDAVTVDVERGKVRVSGTVVEGGRQLLSAGQSFEVPLASPPGTGQLPPSQPADTTPTESPLEEPRQQPLPHEDVLRRSDTLRRQGDPRAAAALLRAALATNPIPEEAAMLAFSLGRLQLDLLHQPRAAAVSFQRARRAGLPPTLREQALAREVHAWAAAGMRQNAKRGAREYLRRYPDGPNRALVLSWLGRTDHP